MDPTSGIVQILSTHSVERQALSPDAAFWPFVYALNEAREDPSVSICRSSGEENGIWMPRDSRDGASDRLLDVFRDPPVILLLKVTDCNDSSSRSDGELFFGR